MVGDVIDRAQVRQRRLAAAEELSMLLGDATACAIAKDSRSYPVGKSHEGRIGALSELLRRIDADSSGDKIAAEAAKLSADWEQRTMPGADESREWHSYRAGGVQALGELAVSSA